MYWLSGALEVTRALPVPAIFPNLQQLVVDQPVDAADWLLGLGDLQSLEVLELHIKPSLPPAPAPVQLPPLLRLTSLELNLLPGTEVQLQLARLPKLAKLRLEGEDGRASLVASQPAPQLRRLVCYVAQLSADFAALPGLASASFDPRQRLDQPASIAAATALTHLKLCDLDDLKQTEWALELLQSLPPSLSCLQLHGEWPLEAALLLGKVPGLRALGLDYWGQNEAPLPPADDSLWTRLRAISWSCRIEDGERLTVPQVWQGSVRRIARCLQVPRGVSRWRSSFLVGWGNKVALRDKVVVRDSLVLINPNTRNMLATVACSVPAGLGKPRLGEGARHRLARAARASRHAAPRSLGRQQPASRPARAAFKVLASLHNPELPDSVQQVVKLAQEEAISLGHSSCEPEHLLLGVLKEAGELVPCIAAYPSGTSFPPARPNGRAWMCTVLQSILVSSQV